MKTLNPKESVYLQETLPATLKSAFLITEFRDDVVLSILPQISPGIPKPAFQTFPVVSILSVYISLYLLQPQNQLI